MDETGLCSSVIINTLKPRICYLQNDQLEFYSFYNIGRLKYLNFFLFFLPAEKFIYSDYTIQSRDMASSADWTENCGGKKIYTLTSIF